MTNQINTNAFVIFSDDPGFGLMEVIRMNGNQATVRRPYTDQELETEVADLENIEICVMCNGDGYDGDYETCPCCCGNGEATDIETTRENMRDRDLYFWKA